MESSPLYFLPYWEEPRWRLLTRPSIPWILCLDIKVDTYHDFSWVPARLNDLASWFPARLALPVIAISTALCGLSGIISLAVAIRDGSKHPNPNSGFLEATMEGALGTHLGGTSFYSGKINIKPFIGDNLRELELFDVSQSHKLMFVASLLVLVVVVSIEIV